MDHTQSPVQSNSAVAHQHTGGCGPPLHWGYGNTTAHIHYAPLSQPPTTSLQSAPSSMVRLSSKRPLSESDDNDDLYSESSKDKCMSPSNSGNCEMLSRKKRRGVIEKKRRDRINTSLSELKRLVPSAFEKQGSAKLEKAEILQLTVDHLKTIHAKGYDSISYDSPCSAKFAMDYHGMGYRDCAAEVSRYLERIEGLDGQNPLRLRLVAHLQTCAVQREKSASAGGTMPAAAPVPPPASASWPPYVGAVTSASAPAPVSSTSHDNQSHNLQMHAQAQSSHTHSHHPQYTDLQPYHHAPMYQHQYMPTMDASAAFHNHHHSPHGPQGTTTTSSSAAAAAASAAAAAAAAMKPYRPWGAELAY